MAGEAGGPERLSGVGGGAAARPLPVPDRHSCCSLVAAAAKQ